MNTLLSLAQVNNQTIAFNQTGDSELLASLGVGFFIFFIMLFIISYVVFALLTGRIFKKAGLAQWPAWVPVYNTWKLLEIGGQKGFWSLFLLLASIPFVGLIVIVTTVFMYISMYHIGKKLGKDGSFILWGIFLPIVWYVWLATDKSVWNDSASSAPSLAAGSKPSSPVTPTPTA